MAGRRTKPLGSGGVPVRPLGATIRAWREHRGLSVTALAESAGLDGDGRSYISKLEHGRIEDPHPEILEGVASALAVSTATLRQYELPPAVRTVRQTESEADPAPAWGAGAAVSGAGLTFGGKRGPLRKPDLSNQGKQDQLPDSGGEEASSGPSEEFFERLRRALRDARLPKPQMALVERLMLAQALALGENPDQIGGHEDLP